MNGINWSDHLLNFVAVILGVSLAFYISDSSARKKEKKELDQIIQSLIDELDTDINVYETYQIQSNKEHAKKIQEVINLIQSNRQDSLYEKFSYINSFNNYAPRNVTFNSITSSGKVDLIGDYELRRKITYYHEVWVAEANFKGENQVNFYNNNLLPWVLENTDFLDPDLSVLDNAELTNILVFYQLIIEGKVKQYERLVEQGKELKAELEAFLTNEN